MKSPTASSPSTSKSYRSRSYHGHLALIAVAALSCSPCDSTEEPSPAGLRKVSLVEPPEEDVEPELLEQTGATMFEAVTSLRDAARDKKVKGLLLSIGPMGGAWARAADLADVLDKARKAKKPVHCYFQAADNVSYWFAARSCDHITIAPAGSLNLVGVSAHLIFAKEALSSIGLQAELLQVGRYKGAADPLTRDEAAPEAKQATNKILDAHQQMLVAQISSHRNIPAEKVRALIDEGPFLAEQAKEAGLVDEVGFPEAAERRAKKAAEARRVTRLRLRPKEDAPDLWELIDAFGEDQEAQPPVERLALVLADGMIVDSNRQEPGAIQSGPFVRAMERLKEDEDVRGVLLRINSPGGSAPASDLMWNAVRRLAEKKPTFVSIGDMAASGGYYIASAGREIFAQPGSLVGSIGVVGGKFVFQDLANKIGVRATVLKRGKNAAWLSPMRPFDEEQEEILQTHLRATYDIFLRRVSEGRNMSPKELSPAAEGRLMTASRAKQLGLVDKIMGFHDCLHYAKDKAGLDPDALVEQWPPRMSMIEALAQTFGADDPEVRAAQLLAASHHLPSAAEQWVRALQPLVWGEDKAAAILPYALFLR